MIRVRFSWLYETQLLFLQGVFLSLFFGCLSVGADPVLCFSSHVFCPPLTFFFSFFSCLGGRHPTPHTEEGKEGAGGGSRIEPRGHNQQRNVNSGRQRMRTARMGGCGSRSTCNKTSPIKSPASQQNAMLCTKSLGFNKTPF